MKTCGICKETKELDAFHNKKGAKDGKQSQCKVCNIARVKTWQADNPEKHEANWKHTTANRDMFARKAKRYGLSVEELQKLMDKADGKCEICSREPVKWLVVDHCHETLRVRGIICERCNQGLGLFADNIEFMKSAIEYLQR